MRITAIQRYSIHDGDGIRTTVFFKGCPLRCSWCHNPETQRYVPELLETPERCSGCGACAAACPENAVSLVRSGAPLAAVSGGEGSGKPFSAVSGGEGSGKSISANLSGEGSGAPAVAVTDRGKCTGCGECTYACPAALREVAGEEMSPEALFRVLIRDRMFFEKSGGGVTFSGGEVMAQDMDEVCALAALLFQERISLFVDTSGEAPYEDFERILPYTRAFLYDLKFVDFEKHRQYTGVGNERILDNLKRLSRAGARIDLRIPLVRGINGTAEETASMISFVKENGIRPYRIHLIPYHNTGKSKYGRLGRRYGGEDYAPPAEEALAAFEAMWRSAGFADVRRGG